MQYSLFIYSENFKSKIQNARIILLPEHKVNLKINMCSRNSHLYRCNLKINSSQETKPNSKQTQNSWKNKKHLNFVDIYKMVTKIIIKTTSSCIAFFLFYIRIFSLWKNIQNYELNIDDFIEKSTISLLKKFFLLCNIIWSFQL